MGEVDIESLMKIKQYIQDLNRGNGWDFVFKVDHGKYETKLGDDDDFYVPDLIDYSNQLIIEYEEESKPRKGPKIIKKGHWEESRHDFYRDQFYTDRNYLILKIWESELKIDKVWQDKLYKFLVANIGRSKELSIAIY